MCACCREQRHETHKRSKCPRASRRLNEARAFTEQLVSSFLSAGNNVNYIFAEEVHWIAQSVSYVSRKTGTDIMFKTSYLKNSPWLVSEVDDPIHAKECVRQLQLGDVSRMTPLELDFRERLLPSLVVIQIAQNVVTKHF